MNKVIIALCVVVLAGMIPVHADVLFGVSYDTTRDAETGGGNKHATAYSSDTPFDLTSGGPAKWGEALDLPEAGATRTLRYATTNNINWTTGTLDLFFRIDDYGADAQYHSIFSADNNLVTLHHGFNLFYGHHSNGYFDRFRVSWNDAEIYLNYNHTTWLTTGTWHHAAVTWDMTGGTSNGVVKLYADGELRAVGTNFNPYAAGGAPGDFMHIGSEFHGNRELLGYVDDVVIYDSIEYSGMTVGDTYTIRTSSAVPADSSVKLFGVSYDSTRNAYLAAGSGAATANSGDTPFDRTSGGPAKWGEALDLPGASGTRTLRYTTKDNINWTTGTLDLFFRIDDYGIDAQNHGIFCADDGALVNWNGLDLYYGHYSSGYFDRFRVSWNGDQIYANYNHTTWLTTGAWHHASVTWDMIGGAGNGVVKLYADGELRAVGTNFDPYAAGGAPGDFMYCGSQPDGNRELMGYIDDVVIYQTIQYSCVSVGDAYIVRTSSSVPVPPPGTILVIR